MANNLVRAIGVEVKDFGAAAAILAGFEAYAWTTFHWAGPASHFAPNQSARPQGLGELVEEDEEEEGDASQEKGKGRTRSSDLTPKALSRARHRTGAPRWTKKLTKLIERHLEVDEETGELGDIPEVLQKIWEMILKLDDTGKEELKERARADKKKARRKEKKAEKKAKKGKGGKKKKRDYSSSSSSSSSDYSSSSSSSSGSSSSSDGKKKKKKKRKSKSRDKGKGKEKAGGGGSRGTRGPEFKVIGGDRHFLDLAGNWINCSRPPSTPCKFCGGKHRWWEGRDHGCSGGR